MSFYNVTTWITYRKHSDNAQDNPRPFFEFALYRATPVFTEEGFTWRGYALNTVWIAFLEEYQKYAQKRGEKYNYETGNHTYPVNNPLSIV